jgi:uncharacterized RDD family membrane protein YckC
MKQANTRMGLTAGWVVSIVLSVSVAARSDTPLPTFALLLGVTLTSTVVAVIATRAIIGETARPIEAPSLAGFWIRLVAFVVDWLPFELIGLVLVPFGPAGQVVVGIAALGYFVGSWKLAGRTVGMKAVGLRVVRDDGGPMTWGSSIRRLAGLVAAFACLYLGVIWVAFDTRKRGWADILGGTLVVRTPNPG